MSSYSPRGVRYYYFFSFFPWGSDDIRYFLLYSTHTLSYISLLLYYIVWYYVYHLSLKMKPCPGCASDANNNRERRYVAAQSLAVIHVDRTPTTTCLSLFQYPSSTLELIWVVLNTTKAVTVRVSAILIVSRNFQVKKASSSSSLRVNAFRFHHHHSNEEEEKQNKRRQLIWIHIVYVCRCVCVSVWEFV